MPYLSREISLLFSKLILIIIHSNLKDQFLIILYLWFTSVREALSSDDILDECWVTVFG